MYFRKQVLNGRSIACGTILSLCCCMPVALYSQDQATPPSATAPDNSAKNKMHSKTADQQKDNTSDREATKKIRQSIMSDKSLSTYAHNVKIITQNGAVTLKGPVNSEEEKQTVASKAAEVVGQNKVTNQLKVKQ
jgi:hyperosmotically inducible periplasmic protein